MGSVHWHHQQVAIWLILGILLVLTIVSVWRGNGGANRADESAEDIVKRRYARGEIDEQALRHMLEELRK